MPLPNSRINKFKNIISRRLLEDTPTNDREDSKKRKCYGLQTAENIHESFINKSKKFQFSNNYCELTQKEDRIDHKTSYGFEEVIPDKDYQALEKNDKPNTDDSVPPNNHAERRISRSSTSISSHASSRDFSPASDNDPTYSPLKPPTANRPRSDSSSSSSSSSSSDSSSTTSSYSSSSSSSSSDRPLTKNNQFPSLVTLASTAIEKITATTMQPTMHTKDSIDCSDDGVLESNNLISVSKPPSVNPMISMAEEGRRNSQKTRKGMNKKKTAQTLRNLGKSYVSSSFKNVPERVMGRPCNEKCRLNCRNVITEEDRKKIFESYWNLGSLARQRDYIAKNLVSIFPKYQYKRLNSNRKPKNAFHFEINGIRTRVCKIFFKNTLGIGDRPIRTVLDKKNEQGIVAPEQRGKHGNKKFISEEALMEVRRHINSIPRIESHYLRKQTSREFIDGGKTLADLYRDYKLECTKKNIKFVQIHIYRKVFKSEFNISFFVPKKDQCDLCTAYKIADIKENLIDKYQCGPWGLDAKVFIKHLSKRLIQATGDQRAGAYLGQRIALAIQRGNVASILGTHPQGSNLDAIFYLN